MVMNVSLGGRLGAALACVLLLAFSSVAAGADQGAASTEQLRQLAVRIYTATRSTEQAHAARAPLADGDVRIATDARKQLDALTRDATVRGYASDANFARKAAQIAKLLANLERAQKAEPDANLPRLIPHAPAEDHVAHVRLGVRNGANCASAITIGAGHAIATTLTSSGEDGSALWLRIAPDRNGFYRLDTAALPLDTEITLFGSSCPSSDAEVLVRDDDSFGLGAAVTVDTHKHPGLRYARIRNLGRAGDVLAQVESAGAITGRIIDERNGQPLSTSVQMLTADGYYVASDYSGDDGFYLLSLDPGSYYVLAGPGFFFGGLIPELYPDTPCADNFGGVMCPTQSAELLTLADGQEISGIDFALNTGATISGVVREADTGNPLAYAQLHIFDASGNSLYFNVSTDIAGRYLIPGLLTGDYFVQADASGHGSQRWDHFTCGGAVQSECQALDGTPLAVVRNEPVAGIDFDLPREASVHAVATPVGMPTVPIESWLFYVYDLAGNYVDGGYSVGDEGAYSGPLAPGSYRVQAIAYGYFSQIWNGIDCPTDCVAQLPTGTILTVDRGEQAEVSFALRPAPVVSGRITDTAQHPLEGINVGLVSVDSPYGMINSTYTLADGSYTLTGTPSGDYYVLAGSNDYRSTVYPDGVCVNLNGACDFSGATSFTIAYGSPDYTGIDFALPANGSISGHIQVRLPAGMSLPPITPDYETVAVTDGNGNYVGAANMTAAGDYTVSGIPAGTFYAILNGTAFGQVWDGIDCTNCNPAAGTPITIAQGQAVTGIDFDPIPVGYIFGRVTDGNGAPLGGVAIDLWNANDVTHCGVGVTNGDGYYAALGSPFCYRGYRVSTDAGSSGYENQVFDDIPCPDGPAYLGLCSLDDATILDMPQTPAFVIANFALIPRPDAIYANGFDP